MAQITRTGDPIRTAQQAHIDISVEEAMRRHPAGRRRTTREPSIEDLLDQFSYQPPHPAQIAVVVIAAVAAIALAAITAYSWITTGQAPL